MGNSLRCCLACVLPCGALDLIRVVHINGHVDEYSGPVSAGDVLRAHPNHVLSKPCPLDDPCSAAPTRRAVIVHPDSSLKRGEIYFLLPEATPPAAADDAKQRRKDRSTTAAVSDGHKEKKAARKPLSEIPPTEETDTADNVSHAAAVAVAAAVAADGYLTELMSERKTMHRRRRSGRVGVWRQQLESITEDD